MSENTQTNVLFRYSVINNFMNSYDKFVKALNWCNENYDKLRKQDRDDFRDIVQRNMDEKWEKLTDEEKLRIIEIGKEVV